MKKIINPYTIMDNFTFDKNGRVIREKNKSDNNLLIDIDGAKNETYKTNHPTIKEISIGDQFITYGGEIVTFIEYSGLNHLYPFNFECFVRNRTGKKTLRSYTINLTFMGVRYSDSDIKSRYITLKDKLNLL